jgi:hypothetical protein
MPAPSLQFQASLAHAHRQGQHGTDPSGYWRQTGCPICAYSGRLRDASDFELVTRHDVEPALGQITWVLRETESRGVWTVTTYGRRPELDFAVGPWGDLMDGGNDPARTFNIPAGVWGKLAEELEKETVK